MPGFSSASTGLTVFTIDRPEAVTADKLKKHAFRSIDNSSEPLSFGWTNIDDFTDTDFSVSPPEKGGYFCFAMRADTRKVQSAVLKRVLREALKAELEACRAAGKEKVSRARKKELKEIHTARLLSKALPVPAVTEAALALDSGLLYVASTSSTALARFQELMGASFGVTCTPLLESSDDAPAKMEGFLKAIYTEGLACESGSVEQKGQVFMIQTGDEVSELMVKNEPASVQAGLDAGLRIVKIGAIMDGGDGNVWEFTLNGNFVFSGLKTPHVDKPSVEDPDAAILEKLYLIEKVVKGLWSLLEAA